MFPRTVDSRKNGDIPSSTVINMLYQGLTTICEDNTPALALAERYELSKDQKTYTFYLRDAKWTDGKPVTAYDFEKSWKKVIDPDFPSLTPQLFYSIVNAEKAHKREVPLDEVGVKAINDKTLVVKLKHPTPYFLTLISFNAFFAVPTHIADKLDEIVNHNPQDLICNGPFKLKRWDYNDKIIVEKNESYWNAKNVFLNSVHISIVKDENTILQMYENNELDYIGAYVAPIPIDSIPYVLKDPNHRLSEIGATTFCAFNLEKFPFNNKNMRKAFGYAINRAKIVKNIIQANDRIATRCIPPILMNDKDFKLYEDNDIEGAKKHFEKGLKELNITRKDLKITFTHSTELLTKKQAEVLQETWEKTFNIKVKLEPLERKVLYDRLHKKQFQSTLAMWLTFYPDPTDILYRFKHKIHSKNYPCWENKKFIELLDYAETLTDLQKREKTLEEAERIFIEDMPISPIYHHNLITLTKPDVKGIFITQIGEVHYDKIYFKK
ncbi:MAG: hypothetical protein AMS24_03925 [Chlamydiae bacterium SM23_39]|nr:MAG: hypothetical protein AMS24_03925 [Chlamydiae bacterium SM23_39]